MLVTFFSLYLNVIIPLLLSILTVTVNCCTV